MKKVLFNTSEKTRKTIHHLSLKNKILKLMSNKWFNIWKKWLYTMRPKLHQVIDSDWEKYWIVQEMVFNNLITIKIKVFQHLNKQITMNKVTISQKD